MLFINNKFIHLIQHTKVTFGHRTNHDRSSDLCGWELNDLDLMLLPPFFKRVCIIQNSVIVQHIVFQHIILSNGAYYVKFIVHTHHA